MMATFPGAAASAVAAADIQRRLGACEWQVPGGIRVRAGLHSGSVHERNGDLFGPPVNRVARLLSKCPPEAVLVSEATAALLVDGMPAGLSLCELGRVELKDMGRGEVVYSLVGDGIVTVDPADVISWPGCSPDGCPRWTPSWWAGPGRSRACWTRSGPMASSPSSVSAAWASPARRSSRRRPATSLRCRGGATWLR